MATLNLLQPVADADTAFLSAFMRTESPVRRTRKPLARPVSLEVSFTMDEAAAELRVSRRKLQGLIKDHPQFCYLNGNRKLFTESDIAGLRLAMRAQSEDQGKRQWASRSSSRAQASRPTTQSGARTSASPWTKAQKLLTELQRKKS
jgi:hypothetical protein